MTNDKVPTDKVHIPWKYVVLGILLGATALYIIQYSGLINGGGNSSAAGASANAEERAKAIANGGFNDTEEDAIRAIVADYLLENPEILPEAMQVLQKRAAVQRIEPIRAAVEKPFHSGFAGNPNGKVTLVEFSDYACGYCKKSVDDVKKLIAEFPDLKIVFRELPILSEDSTYAAKWALAAAAQNKFYNFHNNLFDLGRPNQANIMAAAEKSGMNIAQAQSYMNDPSVQQEIDQNLNFARQLQFTGTPSWIIGEQIFDGAVGYDVLKKAVEEELGT